MCWAASRLLVHESVREVLVEKVRTIADRLKLGPGVQEGVEMGPLVSREQADHVLEYVEEARSSGGKVVAGGSRATDEALRAGNFVRPTILTDVPLDATIANEETFGPVVVVEAVDTPEEAIAAANRTMYGLTSSIFAGNTYKALEMAPKVLAGIVNVNSPTVNDEIHAPMGGVRDSGWGRTGPRSLDDFSDLIWINSHSGQRQYPF
jgi:acyl-CoA reductase-like NAD-dependent aldehyde dehydrogenase